MTGPLVTTLACVTIATERPAALCNLFTDALGWQCLVEGPVDRDLAALWGLAPEAAHGDFVLLRAPGMNRGMVRVVQGRERPPRRPIGARWSGIEILVTADIDGLYRGLATAPDFTVLRPPRDADFSDAGSNIHRFFVGRPPGGTHVIFTQAVTAPQDRAFPTARSRVGHVFDVALVAADYARAQRFYRGTLGMVPILETRLLGGIWHATWGLPEGAVVDLEIVRGRAPGTGLGGIEMQGYDGRFVDPTPPARGALDGGASLVTYTAPDLDAAWRAVVAAGFAPRSPPLAIAAPPYDGGRAFAVGGPGGEVLEICERFADAPCSA